MDTDHKNWNLCVYVVKFAATSCESLPHTVQLTAKVTRVSESLASLEARTRACSPPRAPRFAKHSRVLDPSLAYHSRVLASRVASVNNTYETKGDKRARAHMQQCARGKANGSRGAGNSGGECETEHTRVAVRARVGRVSVKARAAEWTAAECRQYCNSIKRLATAGLESKLFVHAWPF